MDIEELLKEGPSLTLTPEAAPELPAEEKKAEPKVYEEEQYLTEEEKGISGEQLEKMLDDLAKNHSDKRVAYVFPHGGLFSGSANWYKTYKPAILAALEKWGVPYVDIAETTPPMGGSGISALGDKYTSDGTHPNAAGYERFYVEPIAALLKRL